MSVIIPSLSKLQKVPPVNGTNNNFFRDVLGNRNDGHSDTTLYGRVKQTNEHNHKPALLYPLLANSINLVSAAGAWAAFPTPTEIIPANTITGDFDIHWISINTISANGEYVIALYKGDAGSEEVIAYVPAIRTAVQSQEGSAFCMTELIDANVRISASLSSSNAGANNLNIKIGYHKY